MGRPRTWQDDDLVEAFHKSRSIAQILRSLGLSPTGANYKNIKLHMERLDLDHTNLPGQAWRAGRESNFKGQPLEEILVEGSTYTNSTRLKERLIAAGMLSYECAAPRCSIKDEWLGEPIRLQLDHINGDNRDHRLENLRLLCPNCHAQTKTFCRGPSGV